MADYVDFFLGAKRSVVQLETIEISHPNFSKTYRIVRNATEGITATDENGVSRFYEYYPVRLTRQTLKDDLDHGITVALGDVGDITGPEILALRAANAMLTKPTLKYRLYRSDDLSGPMDGPYLYEISQLSTTPEGCQFEAKAKSLNMTATGILYRLQAMPTLIGFL